MDISEYLPMFLAEAREHLQELNLAIVRIEEQPDDRAELAKDALMPSVRAFQVLAVLAEHGTVVRSAPPESALEGWEGRVIEAWVQTPHEPEALRQAVLEVSDVAAAAAADAGAEAA